MAKTNETQTTVLSPLSESKNAKGGTNRKHGLEKKQGGAFKQERLLAKQTTMTQCVNPIYQNWL